MKNTQAIPARKVKPGMVVTLEESHASSKDHPFSITFRVDSVEWNRETEDLFFSYTRSSFKRPFVPWSAWVRLPLYSEVLLHEEDHE